MTKIWGFDLSEMHWGAFGSKKMFEPGWYLRKERIIIYKIAMLTGLAAECCATYSLAKYDSKKSDIERASSNTAEVHKNDIYAASCVTIVFCVLVATLFGADFFFLVFWPRRRYPRWYNWSRKGLAVGITLGMAAAAVMSTVVVGFHEAYVVGPTPEEIDRLVAIRPRPPLVYRTWPTNIAWVVLLWIAFLSTLASTVVMFLSVAHDTTHGTAPYPRNPNLINLDGPDMEKGSKAPYARGRDRTHVIDGISGPTNGGATETLRAPAPVHVYDDDVKGRRSLGSSTTEGGSSGHGHGQGGYANPRVY